MPKLHFTPGAISNKVSLQRQHIHITVCKWLINFNKYKNNLFLNTVMIMIVDRVRRHGRRIKFLPHRKAFPYGLFLTVHVNYICLFYLGR